MPLAQKLEIFEIASECGYRGCKDKPTHVGILDNGVPGLDAVFVCEVHRATLVRDAVGEDAHTIARCNVGAKA